MVSIALLTAACSSTDDPQAAALTTAPVTPSSTTPARPPSAVYVIVLDELPLENLLHDGALNRTRFPNFAALAETSTWYTNGTVHSGRTIHSVPSILSGVLPRNTLATPEEYPTNLFDTMGDAGWAIHALEHNSWLCSPTRCPGSRPYPEPEPRQPSEVLEAFTAGLADSNTWPIERPTLHVLHLVLPHPPWTQLPDGNITGSATESVVGSRWPSTPWLTATARVEAQWQLGATDLALARLIDAIRDRGDWDRSLVVVTADHGQDLAPGHNSRDILPDNQRDTVWVPTFVKAPRQTTGGVDDSPHTATELAGLVLDVADVPRTAGVGEHQRVIVTDVWPYVEGAPLTFGPVDESARPPATGEIVDGPGWDGLVDAVARAELPAPIVGRLGSPVDLDPLHSLGGASIDQYAELVGARRGACGWDVTISGNLAGGPDATQPYVGLVVDGRLRAVAPVDAVWPGASATIKDRPSFFRLLLEPASVPAFVDPTLVGLDANGSLLGRYDATATTGIVPMRCPAPLVGIDR